MTWTLGRGPGRRAQSARKSLPAMTASAAPDGVEANARRAGRSDRDVVGVAEEDRVVEVEDQTARMPAEDRELPGGQQLALEDHRVIRGRPDNWGPVATEQACGSSGLADQIDQPAVSRAGSKARIRYRQQT